MAIDPDGNPILIDQHVLKGEMMNRIATLLIILCLAQAGLSQGTNDKSHSFPLNSLEDLEFVNVKGTVVEHQDKAGLRVTAKKEGTGSGGPETFVIIPDITFSNGIIELEIAGEPAPGAIAQARGFVGIAFRVNRTDISQYECFYMRPTNGRAKIQAQRNHSIQYISHPDYPWYRLREEAPEMYESYVDIVPGNWTQMKIEVIGSTAKLYLHDSDQPNLIVNDLKHGESSGAIALWLHASTLAHYRNLVITPSE